jgi:hypothetical protein
MVGLKVIPKKVVRRLKLEQPMDHRPVRLRHRQ